MTNNDVLRRLRYAFDFPDAKMIALFALGGQQTNRAEVSDWLKRDDDPAHRSCDDGALASFLNGLIVDRRGAREGGPPPREGRIDNNAILVKLKIALNLQADDMLELLRQGGHVLSKHELSAFFRKAGHKHYRECKDQVLRKFLAGLQIEHRGSAPDEPDDAEDA